VGKGQQVGRRPRHAAALLAATLLVAACSGGGSPEPVALPTPTPSLAIEPAPGAVGVLPDAAVTVTATGLTVNSVVVDDAAGERVEGTYDAAGGRWTPLGRLRVSERYTVTASGLDGGGAVVSQTSEFATLEVPEAERLYAKFAAPHDGDVVGVAHPLAIGFNHPVRDKRAVQAALELTTEVPGQSGGAGHAAEPTAGAEPTVESSAEPTIEPSAQPTVEPSAQPTAEAENAVEGAWYWVDDSYVHYRPKEFWPVGTKISLRVGIGGLKVGERWGGADRELSYRIGRKQTIEVDAAAKVLRVVGGKGKVLRSFPVSTGKPGWETRSGTKVLMEKILDKKWTNEAIDAPEFYRLESAYALRMTNSGEFIHDAPWNTGNIGSANTSHGCVGLRVSDMAWVYEHSIVGDPVIVTNSGKPYTNLINRYADWNIDWETWSAGNADKAYL
jgi:lipoprotein-anchoring transpeptidase ErfK/SrfK